MQCLKPECVRSRYYNILISEGNLSNREWDEIETILDFSMNMVFLRHIGVRGDSYMLSRSYHQYITRLPEKMTPTELLTSLQQIPLLAECWCIVRPIPKIQQRDLRRCPHTRKEMNQTPSCLL
eukprot:Lithocolla_globosa_v1_NODE_346_length_4383_cov_46.262055.p7 type:complete len:123 gc:universal NODE_346_length_4383_cov_46.262055:3342-3710(+)